jgi:CheY-like chemotaxis protein
MPVLDGPTFYALLTRQYPALRQRIIFLTGDTLGADSQAFLKQCGQPWLRKPSPIATIRRTIQHVLQTAAQA